jgi:hypothetical protein
MGSGLGAGGDGGAMPSAAGGGAKPRVSDAAVQQATGRSRGEWFGLLDAWGGAERAHRELAAWLGSEHGVDGWWAQTITVDYEQARGLRQPGARRDGSYEVNVTRTIAAPAARVFEAVVDPGERERWAPGAALHERTAQPGRSARFDWEDGATRVIFGFTGRGPERSQVALTHERVPDGATADRLREYWRERLEALKAVLEA